MFLVPLCTCSSSYLNGNLLFAARKRHCNLLWPYFQPYYCAEIILSQMSDSLSDSKAISYLLCSWASLDYLIHLTCIFLKFLWFTSLQIYSVYQIDLLQMLAHCSAHSSAQIQNRIIPLLTTINVSSSIRGGIKNP